MKKTYSISIIPRKMRTTGAQSRINMDVIFDKAVENDDLAFWNSPEGRRCQRAFRLWRNLADSEMPVSGRVVTRLVDILDRAFDGARERGYARRCTPYEWWSTAPVGMNPTAQYVPWTDPIRGGRGYNIGICRV